ncbi:hypothetical protein [Gordonia sp. CPCC 205333]|uniref:hypothetical protein n=1 Tax=Gordonia sp. CPCC 205333 TaxID=3140790 RepID=UPI003AF3FC00
MTDRQFCCVRCRWDALLHPMVAYARSRGQSGVRRESCGGDPIAPWRPGYSAHCPRRAQPLSTLERLFADLENGPHDTGTA